MVQLQHIAVALAIGSPAVAVPHWNLPQLPDVLSSFTIPTAFPTLPGYGQSSSTSVIASSSTKPASSGASKPSVVSSIVASGSVTSKSRVSVGPATGSTSLVFSSSVSSSKTLVSVAPVTGTSARGTSPAGTSKKTTTIYKTSVGTAKPSSSTPASSKRPSSSAASGSGVPKPPSTSTGSSAQPTVSTTSGNVVGYPAPNTTDVWQYLGIKFGQAPVGDLRFAPPVAYTGTGLINGSTFGADCPCAHENVPTALGPRLYTLLGTLAQVNDTLAEDCLFVNVWAKAGSANKPVLVWIYGGGFNFGGTNSEAYNGRFFADDEDVVFVSLNYRTNVMGFPGAPNITQNVGLLDQRLAIEWVRDNIAAFGGDPSRITIFGQSAGGASVDLYTFSYYNDPIIAGAIPMSGSANSFGSRTLAQSLTSWDNVTTNLGCGNSSNTPADTVLSCMRSPSITWEAIQNVSQASAGLSSLLGNFGPTVDETIVFSNYTERVLDGYVAKVPVLTGNDNYESGLFILISAGAGESYPQSTWDYIDQQVFTCPVSRTARYRAAIGIPSWRYYYSAGWNNTILPTANLTQAWHTGEVPVLFGVSEEITLTADAANETALGNLMRSAWATFAADPVNGLPTKFGWPQYSSGQLINLGLNHEAVPSFSNASAIEDGCSF